MAKTNFNDLFKSELGIANDDHLVDCPHCEAPITKSDLTKASDVAKQNASGKTMRGGDGRGQVKSTRPGAGVPKSDPPVGIQNSKGSRARKGGCDDDSSSDASSIEKPPMKKGMTIRGTEVVQYIDYGDAPGSDAMIAKSIAEGAISQQPTMPMDITSDMSRLLV